MNNGLPVNRAGKSIGFLVPFSIPFAIPIPKSVQILVKEAPCSLLYAQGQTKRDRRKCSQRGKQQQRDSSDGHDREHWNLPSAHGAAKKKQHLLCLKTQDPPELKAPSTVNVRLRRSTGKRVERLF